MTTPIINGFLRKTLTILGLVGCLIQLGCQCYQWGDPCSASVPFRTLYIKPVVNNSYAPQVEYLLSAQLAQLFHQSGVRTVACEGDADASVEIVLKDYHLSPATTLALDTGVADSFYVTLTGFVTLTNNHKCCDYFTDRPVESTVNVIAMTGIEESLYHDMPSLARHFANNVRNIVVSSW